MKGGGGSGDDVLLSVPSDMFSSVREEEVAESSSSTSSSPGSRHYGAVGSQGSLNGHGSRENVVAEDDPESTLVLSEDKLGDGGAASGTAGAVSAVVESRQRTAGELSIFVNLLKTFIGSGVLGLPYAFKTAGLLTTAVLLTVVALLATHTMGLLVVAKHRINLPEVVTFTDLGRHTMGRFGAALITVLLLFTQYGFCCVYMVFLSQTSHFLVQQVWPLLKEDEWEWTWRLFVVAWVFPLFAVSNIRTLEKLTPVTLSANLCILTGVVLTAVSALWNFVEAVRNDDLDIQYWINWHGVPTAFGLAVYAFEGIGVVLPSETAMKRPQNFNYIMKITMVIASFCYMSFGVVGYIGFGRDIADGGIVSFNMYDWATDIGNPILRIFWVVLTVISFFFLMYAIFATYPVQLYVVTDIFEEFIVTVAKPKRGLPAIQVALRAGLVVSTAIVAVSVPDFGILMGFIGSLGATSLQFILPPLIYGLVFRADLRVYEYPLLAVEILVGIIGAITGTVLAVIQIIELYV